MRKFIFQCGIFIGLLVIVVFSMIGLSAAYLNNKARFKIKPDTQIVLFGDSHPECAFNDSLINNLENYAQSGEIYYYNYFKLKKIIEQNPNIQTVFVDFSNNQIQPNRDQWIWGDKYISNRLPKFFPFMNAADLKILYSNNFSGFINSLSLYLKETFKRLLKKDFNYSNHIGGYQYLVRDKTDSLLKHLPLAPALSRENKRTEYNLLYLDKIVAFCKENNKKIFLVRSPLHPQLPELKDEKLFMDIVRTRFAGIEFLDFKNFPASNSEFGDLEHLNFRGARNFSIWVNNLLNSGLLKQKQKQEFIDQKMHEYSLARHLNPANN